MQRIRRYDIFSIVNFLGMKEEKGEAAAKGEAIWLSKVVASRKFRGYASKKGRATAPTEKGRSKKTGEEVSWKTLSGVPQTDETYEREIVQRFGTDKYKEIERAVAGALEKGLRYQDIRDCEHARRGSTGWCAQCSLEFAQKLNEF